MKQWVNTIAAGVLFLFSATLYYLVPSQTYMIETEKAHMSPAFYPQLVIISLMFVSLIYLIMSFVEAIRKHAGVKEDKAGKEGTAILARSSTRTLITIAIVLIYVYVFEFLGFFVATPLLLGVMMLHMGNFRILPFCMVVIFTPLIMYIIFERLMVILLPRGSLF